MKHISTILFLVIGLISNAQNTYMVNGPIIGQGPLLNTENSTTIAGWTEIHAYNAGLGSSDNSWSAAQSLPFAFDYYGTAVTQFCVSKNFLLTFDPSVAGTTLNATVTTDNTSLPNADLPDNTIAYFWGGFGNPAPLSSNDDVWMRTLGTAPNRQLWVKNFSYEGEAQSYSYNFVVLEETTNKIYVVDARWISQGAGTYTVGVQQNAATAVEHSSSPNIASINGNVTTWNGTNVNYYEFIPFLQSPNDAILTSIDVPSSTICNATSNIEVTIGSNGTNDLTAVNINWSVNSVAQTPYAWTGTITQFGTNSGNLLGNYTFSDGDLLKVWTSDPNVAIDGDNTNDTLEISIDFGLSGTYSIGTAGDYTTFTDAVADINALGVCGNVVFEVETGTYNEQIILNEVPGMDVSNTVTFRSQSGDSTDVILEYAGTGVNDNYVVWFDGADYFSFESMSLQNTTSVGFGKVVVVDGGADYNKFSNCIFTGDLSASSTSFNVCIIYSADGEDSYWTFENNRFIGGSYGVYWFGESATPYEETGTVFNNNSFELNYYRGARLYYQQSPEFTNNSASYNTGIASGLDVFYFGYCDSSLAVTGNYVYLDGIYGDGMTFYYCEGSASTNATVANNQIIINTPLTGSAVTGIFLSNSDFPNLYHNSIYIDNASTLSEGIYSTGGIQNTVINNSIMNNGVGYSVYYNGSTTVGTSDYNNLYAPNGNIGYLGGAFATMNDWQLGASKDANSISFDPVYNAIDDLHTCSADLDNMGMPGLGVSSDFDGELRDVNTPDIGADEFFTITGLDLGADTSKCVGISIVLGEGIIAPGGSYLWNEGSITQTISVTDDGEYTLEITGSCGIAKDTITVIDIPNAIAGFTQSTSFLTAILTDASVGATSWDWDFGDGNTSALENPVHVYATPGTYTITLTVTGECGTDVTTQDFEAQTVGLDENLVSEFRVYPNPTEDVLNLQFYSVNDNKVDIQIIDLTGKVVMSKSLIVNEGNNTQVLSVGEYESGLYLVSIETISGVVIRRFEVK